MHECVCWRYLRIVLTVFINAYRGSDVGIHRDLILVALEQMYLSCEVVDTLNWGNKGTMNWIEGGHSHYKLARPQL